MTYPDDENGEVFRRMESHGFDFSVEHVVDFHAVMATEEAVRGSISACLSSGFSL